MAQKTINVKGMGCEHCKTTVEGAVSALAGVSSATVDLEANTVTYQYDEAQVSDDQVVKAINDSGYTAEA